MTERPVAPELKKDVMQQAGQSFKVIGECVNLGEKMDTGALFKAVLFLDSVRGQLPQRHQDLLHTGLPQFSRFQVVRDEIMLQANSSSSRQDQERTKEVLHLADLFTVDSEAIRNIRKDYERRYEEPAASAAVGSGAPQLTEQQATRLTPEEEAERRRIIEQKLKNVSRSDPETIAQIVQSLIDQVGVPDEGLTGKEKAAGLLIGLGPEISSYIIRKLPEGEIGKITHEILELERLEPHMRDEIFEEAYEEIIARESAQRGEASVPTRGAIAGTVSDERPVVSGRVRSYGFPGLASGQQPGVRSPLYRVRSYHFPGLSSGQQPGVRPHTSIRNIEDEAAQVLDERLAQRAGVIEQAGVTSRIEGGNIDAGREPVPFSPEVEEMIGRLVAIMATGDNTTFDGDTGPIFGRIKALKLDKDTQDRIWQEVERRVIEREKNPEAFDWGGTEVLVYLPESVKDSAGEWKRLDELIEEMVKTRIDYLETAKPLRGGVFNKGRRSAEQKFHKVLADFAQLYSLADLVRGEDSLKKIIEDILEGRANEPLYAFGGSSLLTEMTVSQKKFLVEWLQDRIREDRDSILKAGEDTPEGLRMKTELTEGLSSRQFFFGGSLLNNILESGLVDLDTNSVEFVQKALEVIRSTFKKDYADSFNRMEKFNIRFNLEDAGDYTEANVAAVFKPFTELYPQNPVDQTAKAIADMRVKGFKGTDDEAIEALRNRKVQ